MFENQFIRPTLKKSIDIYTIRCIIILIPTTFFLDTAEIASHAIVTLLNVTLTHSRVQNHVI